jgi:hypothetical protein
MVKYYINGHQKEQLLLLSLLNVLLPLVHQVLQAFRAFPALQLKNFN